MDGEDGATVVTDTIKDDEDRTEPKSCPQQTVKVRGFTAIRVFLLL